MIEYRGIRAWWRRRRKPKTPLRRMLTHADFNVLVRGGEVERDGVTIALADIGLFEMNDAIQGAWKDLANRREAGP